MPYDQNAKKYGFSKTGYVPVGWTKAWDVKQLASAATVTRFVDGAVGKKLSDRTRKYSQEQIREVVRLLQSGLSRDKVAALTGIKASSIKNWQSMTRLPVKPTSPYTFEKVMKVVQLARHLYRQGFSQRPVVCLREAVNRTPTMKWKSLGSVYLTFECVPTLPGFPLYCDPEVQARCEALGKGLRERGTRLFDAPAAQAAAPATPHAGPAPAPRVSDRDSYRAGFLAARQRLGLQKSRI